MKQLEITQLENLNGGGCLEYLAGFGLIAMGASTGLAPLAYAGLVIGINNASSCGETVSSWFD